jgi:hypothetical protein
LPVVPDGGNLFYARHEKGAMILSSNRGFAEWGDHYAIVIQIEGSSYRLRQHADLVTEHLRRTAPITTQPTQPPRRRGRPPKNRSLHLELTRFRGHPEAFAGGVRDAKIPIRLPARVPPSDGGACPMGRTPEELSREFEPAAKSIANWVRQADRDAGKRSPR